MDSVTPPSRGIRPVAGPASLPSHITTVCSCKACALSAAQLIQNCLITLSGTTSAHAQALLAPLTHPAHVTLPLDTCLAKQLPSAYSFHCATKHIVSCSLRSMRQSAGWWLVHCRTTWMASSCATAVTHALTPMPTTCGECGARCNRNNQRHETLLRCDCSSICVLVLVTAAAWASSLGTGWHVPHTHVTRPACLQL
jgi:hypothetical protein